jgi:hypothetical protein
VDAISLGEMWKFLSRVFPGPAADQPQPPPLLDPSHVNSMLQAIDEGVSQRALPTLVCRQCGLKYNNTGTYLSGSTCPDCTPRPEGDRS